ncbi:Tmn3p [Sugiyamaella lignohabitans]|uniref:Transmembrane 9 superfamily member n=1 Tax=Sugiyamaella lignohabitans TaxID=796027 RepID=A0A161HJW9_9ASCO|nr:Tmn3p [Sugiyamaella lignohabitans]ANB11808.1 Tmn3p [Sugiyamaella lignohabitans]
MVMVCEGFYIPGWSIKSYKDGEKVPLFVNKVTSDTTQLPYAYYDLPFVCKPSKDAERVPLNLGEVLLGDRIWGSDYQIHQGKQVDCAELCTAKVDKAALERAHELVSSNYLVEWIVDNLPGATAFISVDRSKRYYASGFPLGVVDETTGKTYLNNHVSIILRYRESSRDKGRNVIVGFEVYPKSVSTDSKKCPGNNDKFQPYLIDPEKENDEIRFTYTVLWREDKTVEWADRWSLYFSYLTHSSKAPKVNSLHWLAIVNSLVIASLLTILVGVVLVRTLSRDIQSYKKISSKQGDDDLVGELDKDMLEEESGWKLVYADVFRPPVLSSVLSSLIGSGIQIFVMALATIGFACFGVLNPSYRGGLLSYALFIFAFAGGFAGFVTARINKYMGNEYHWSRSVWLTAVLAPASVLIIVLTLNLFVWSSASSSALPFGTIVALFSIWLLISCPLVVVGAIIGNKRQASPPPTRISAIPRQIPNNAGYNLVRSTPFAVLAGGLLPFAVIFVELVTIFQSLWLEKSGYYYMYGFFGVVFIVLVLTVVEMSILTTYILLNSEDYRWWWRSFLVGTGSAWWVFLYSIYYYFTKLNVDGFISALLFFGYTLLGCLAYGLVTGAIGFLSSYVFVFRIYNAIKAD